ncbi:DUF418 domain-containing protein [Sphingomonas sp. KR1UV-12]|uniref:DUF418 domain-containing protein n=1 Tax=Sphingomonas aurea TaxID=3063994 RepID=A0ABT9EN36_9SPHN|nr:DUF418 domain-containing protein [Sphingomonas sp. KR1UV-12]MDP1028356.1 DUF418 domain-containing protein [Sphingomonas sp. KR1UV-12]
MTVSSPDPGGAGRDRLVSLDVIRGVAVMGILAANLPAFALPEAAYFSPMAAGGTAPADIALWLANLVLVEGRMRGLFSLLFGASMLLVIDRARAQGDRPAATHMARMAVLFVIGLIHLYLIWWGDILAHYALCGVIAYPLTRLSPRPLVLIGIALSLLGMVEMGAGLEMLVASAARDTPQAVATWNSFAVAFGIPPAADLAQEIAAHRAGYLARVAWRWHHAMGPLEALWLIGPQTLGTMLIGMAAYRTGFLTGGWPRARYRRWAIACLALSLGGYAWLGVETIRHGFALPWVYAGSMVVSQPLRVIGTIGYAALVILLLRPGGALTARIAAAGRVAFTNYLGTSIMMTCVFGWGLGQYAMWSRAALYLLAPLAWAVMLAWSAPWLARFRYGPFEWLWRSLSRAAWQPLRRLH